MYRIKDNYKQVETLFQSNINTFVFQSIISGNTAGEIYLNSLSNPELYIIFDIGNFVLYVGGNSNIPDEHRRCLEYVKSNILTESLKEEYYDYIKISYTSDIWKDVILNTFADLPITKRRRVLFDYNLSELKKADEILRTDHSFKIKPIDVEVIANSSLKNLDLMKEELAGMWGSVEGFLTNGGFGTCALDGEKLLSWCTAELLSANHCGVGIETMDSQQKRGVGTALAAAFVKECSRRKLNPHWDSWLDNGPSVKIAKKVGFTKFAEYDVLVVRY